jgi:hypothetical protein
VFLFTQLAYGSRDYWSFEKAVKKSPVLIEGVVVDIPPAYYAGRSIYTSRIVKVLKVFKGKIDKEYIEIPIRGGTVGDISLSISSCGTLHLPGKGRRAIFCLKSSNLQDSTSNDKFKKSGSNLANNYIVHPYYDAFVIDIKKNVEIEYYQKIEKITKKPRRVIQSINPTKRTGIEVKVDRVFPVENGEYLDVWIKATAKNNEILYLENLSFDIEYSKKVFGKKVSRKKNIEINKKFPKYKQNIVYLIPNILVGDSIYSISCTDKSKSSLHINLSHKVQKEYFQLTSNYINVIRFKVHRNSGTVDFKIVNESIKGRHYKYPDESIVEFDEYSSKTSDFGEISFYKKPIINSFYPDTVLADVDTLTIYGENLLSKDSKVLIRTKKQACGFHKPVPKENIILHSKNEIKLIIPSVFKKGGSACGTGFYPVHGFIISKGDVYLSEKSTKKLIIKLPDD